MDKKSIIGLALVGVILFGYSWWQGKQAEKARDAYEKAEYAKFVADSTDRAQHPEKYMEEVISRIQDTLKHEAAIISLAKEEKQKFQNDLARNFGDRLVSSMNGDEKLYVLENNVMRMTVSSLGGRVVDVTLKDYKRYDKKGNGEQVKLFVPESSKFDLSFYLRKGYSEAKLNTSNFYFISSADSLQTASGADSVQLSLRLPVEDNAYVEFLYTMRPDDYMVDYNVRFVGMEAWMQTVPSFDIAWSNTSYQNEKGYQNENMYTTISYLYPGDHNIEKLGMSNNKRGSNGAKSQTITTKFEWFDFQQQFFSSIMIAPEGFSNGELAFSTYKPGTGLLKDFSATATVPFDLHKNDYRFNFYFGPNKYSLLKGYGLGLEKVVQLGGWLVRWVNRWLVIPTFDFLHRFIGSYGLIILILTLMIKLIIFPLTYKSYLSSAKMRALKPEIDRINAKYPDQKDQQEMLKRQQATMDLYKKCGVSPMGGCLPLLIQMPIVIAMFRFFPTSIELRGQRFLWAEDLSAYDSVLDLPFNIPWYGDHISLFALIMAVTLFFYSRISYEQTASQGPQMAGMKFMTIYLMPIMMLMWMNNYASGLCYYYFLSQIVTIGQTWAFRRSINNEKLYAQLMANSNKPSKQKKSRWQQRIAEMQKQQQEMLKEREKRQYRSKR